MRLDLDRDTLNLLPTDRDPLQPDDRERAARLRDWCLVWMLAAAFGWGLTLYLVITWPGD